MSFTSFVSLYGLKLSLVLALCLPLNSEFRHSLALVPSPVSFSRPDLGPVLSWSLSNASTRTLSEKRDEYSRNNNKGTSRL